MQAQQTNEALCVAAAQGDEAAKDALTERNLPFIKRTAAALWSAQRQRNTALGIEIDDLVQEGALGLLACIGSFRGDAGNSFLSYAAPAIRNAMLDYIRRQNPTFEAKKLDSITRLDELSKEESGGKEQFVADPRVEDPEQLCMTMESCEAVHRALQRLDLRERTYLSYRFGLDGEEAHTLRETAEHFRLSVSRAKGVEKRALERVKREIARKMPHKKGPLSTLHLR